MNMAVLISAGLLMISRIALGNEEITTRRAATMPNLESWENLYEADHFHSMPYRLLKPFDFPKPYDSLYPLVVCLHGMGGRGNDNERQMKSWTEILADEDLRMKYPAFVIAPQTKKSWASEKAKPVVTQELLAEWPEPWRKAYESGRQPWLFDYAGDLENLFALLDEMIGTYPIDRVRVYILGHSMGGIGVWNALCAAPDRFAAAISSAGGLAPWLDPSEIVNIPIWSFHGIADTTIPLDFAEFAFARMKKLNGNMKLTRLEGVKHNSNEAAFGYAGDQPDKGFITEYSSDRGDPTPDVWGWLFAQKKAIETVKDDQ